MGILKEKCDLVLDLESKEAEELPKNYNGFLKILKIPQLNTIETNRPLASRYGLKLIKNQVFCMSKIVYR